MEKQNYTEAELQQILARAKEASLHTKKKRENDARTKRIMTMGEVGTFCSELKGRLGYDYVRDPENKFPCQESTFQWGKWKEKIMREADTSSVFVQFLRAGVQKITNGMYESTEDTYSEWVTVVPSKLSTELYAPNQGISFPGEVGPTQIFPEVGMAALNIQLRNRKYGTIFSVEKELLNDDQTGTVQQQMGVLGEYMKLVAEVLCYGKLASISGGCTYSNLLVPASETQPSDEATYPWSTSLQGGGANRPGSFGIFNNANMQAGFIGLMNQVNLQGLKMMVKPNRLIVGPQYQFDAAVLLNSAFYPAGAQAAGVTGGAFATNVLKGLANLTVSRFVFSNAGTAAGLSTSKAWYLVDDSKPWFILQQREAISVTQENPESGQSFDREVYRFKGSARMNADFLDPRFAWQGDDGSVTS